MIYLVANSPFKHEKIINLKLNRIDFLKFGVNLDEFDALVLTSKTAIEALKINSIIPSKKIEVYCIGSGCAATACEFGFKNVFEANSHHGNDFAREIAPKLNGKKILFLRALETASNVGGILRENGARLNVIIAYENYPLRLENPPEIEVNSVVIFTAPSSVKNFLANFSWRDDLKAVCIGETTAKAIDFTKPFISRIQSVEACVSLALELDIE